MSYISYSQRSERRHRDFCHSPKDMTSGTSPELALWQDDDNPVFCRELSCLRTSLTSVYAVDGRKELSLKMPKVPDFGQMVWLLTKNRGKCTRKAFSDKCRTLTIDGNFRVCQVLRPSTKSKKFVIWKASKNMARLLDLGSRHFGCFSQNRENFKQ